jgi:hypothetical protein
MACTAKFKDFGAFGTSVLTGALAAAVVPMAQIVFVVVQMHYQGMDGLTPVTSTLMILGFIMLVSFIFALLGCLLVGLPATVVLGKYRKESPEAYLGIGCFAGFAIPLALMCGLGLPELWWYSFLGAFGGAAAALTWWTMARKMIAPNS